MLEVTVNGIAYDVAADGTIYQPLRGGHVTLDAVREIAADLYLSNEHRALTSKEQRAAWQRIKDMPPRRAGAEA